MNCLRKRLIGRSWSAAIVLGVIAFHSVFAGRAQAQWLFPFGGGYRYKSVTRSGPGLSLFPGRTMMMAPSLGFAPVMGQSMAFSPVVTGQSFDLSPTTLSLSPQNTLFLSSGTTSGTTLSFAPQATFQVTQGTNSGATLAFSPQFNGVQTITFSGSPTAEHGMQLLSMGFRNDPTKVNGFLQGLKSKLESLVGAVGKNLTKQDVEDLLMTAAKSALASTGFGFAGPALDLFLKPLIDKLIGDRLPDGTGSTGTTIQLPVKPGTADKTGGTFQISGTVTFTPVNGSSPDGGMPANPQNQPQQGNGFTIPGANQNAPDKP
jgi:hypothetical protein